MRGLRVLCTLAAVLKSSATKHEISLNIRCVQTNAHGFCIEWTQSGSIEESTACFPPTALVQTPDGHKTIGELAIGDKVLAMGKDGRVTFSPLRAWLHRDPTSDVTYLAFKTAAGTLRTTPSHNVFVATEDGGEYVLAKHVEVGDRLRTANGVAEVDNIVKVVEHGAFAPLTYESNLFVGDEADALLLAHSYAVVSSPALWQPFFDTLLRAAEMAFTNVHEVTDPDLPYLHPLAKAFAPLIGIPVEPKVEEKFDGYGLARRRLNDNQQQQQRERERTTLYIQAMVISSVLMPLQMQTANFSTNITSNSTSNTTSLPSLPLNSSSEDSPVWIVGVVVGVLVCCCIVIKDGQEKEEKAKREKQKASPGVLERSSTLAAEVAAKGAAALSDDEPEAAAPALATHNKI